MRRKLICSLGITIGIFPFFVFGARLVTETTDFLGTDIPVGWIVTDGEYLSRTYSNSVIRIALSYEEAGQPGEAQLFAIDYASGAETQIASVNTVVAGTAFDFPVTSDYRQFRIVTDGLSLASFSATWLDTRLDAPSNIVATALTTDSLEISWDKVEGASSYRVSIWTNVVVGAFEGSVFWKDMLPGATNGASSTRMSDEKFNNCFANAGWTRSEKAGYPTGEGGTTRIGTKDATGWLQTPPIDVSGSGVAIRFHAKIGESNTNPKMRVERISGNETNLIGEVALASQLKEYLIMIPEWNSGDSVRFNSFESGDRRTVIGAVALVSGYSTGTASPVIIKEVPMANAASCMVDGLPESVLVFVGVSAIDQDGVSSERSAGVEVDLANPPPHVTLNAYSMSDLVDSVYVQDYDSLAEPTSTTGDKDWFNGITLPYWQLWQDNEAASKFAYYAGGNQTGAKFVAVATNVNDRARALGARTKQGTTMIWGLAFTNNTGFAAILTNVTYSAQQWGFANTTNQLFSCAYLVTNRLDWIVDFTYGWQSCAETEAQVFATGTHQMPEPTVVESVLHEGIRIAPGEVLYLKWTFRPPAKGSSALMAIDDLSVGFNVLGRGLLMRLVKNRALPR